MCSFFLGARYLSERIFFEAIKRDQHSSARGILIYGAGRAGVALLAELRLNPTLDYRVLGFVDDNPRLTNVYVQGVKVVGRGQDLSTLVALTEVTEVLIALPSATADQMLRILQYCQQARVRFRTVAAISEAVEGKALTSQIREVDVQDLLSRVPVDLDHGLVRESLQGKVVMVTGAAGSIGLSNVFRTRNVAMAAADCGVEEFVLISSDKAVRPTSVMGATKRLCELLIRALPPSRTRYVAVRFGNVLGSNGSVIPVFKQQVATGGPVTVTHPDRRRYFMTIPEAAQLVLTGRSRF